MDPLDIDSKLQETIDARRRQANTKGRLALARLSLRQNLAAGPNNTSSPRKGPESNPTPAAVSDIELITQPHLVQEGPSLTIPGSEPRSLLPSVFENEPSSSMTIPGTGTENNNNPDPLIWADEPPITADEEDFSKFDAIEKWYNALRFPTLEDRVRYETAKREEDIRRSRLASRRAFEGQQQQEEAEIELTDNELFCSPHVEGVGGPSNTNAETNIREDRPGEVPDPNNNAHAPSPAIQPTKPVQPPSQPQQPQKPPVNRRKRTNRISAAERRQSMQVGLNAALSAAKGTGNKRPRKRSRRAANNANTTTDANGDDAQNGSNNKRRRRGCRNATEGQEAGTNETDLLQSLFRSDVIAEGHTSSALPAIPGFTERDKEKALTQLLASIPAADQDEAKSDRDQILEATRKITTKARSDGKGGWKINGMLTSLYHYQLLGMAFMRDRENSPQKPHGGLLCDVMGFGKTLQALANIVDGRPLDPNDPEKTTLIVVPAHLTKHWSKQIHRHCDPAAIGPVLEYHARSRFSAHDLISSIQYYSVVITTYDEVRRSYPQAKPPDNLSNEAQIQEWWEQVYREEAGPLHQIKFRRIVLDEGHVIKNPESKVSIAVRALTAKYKWIISGTPLHNCIEEFYPYFDFLNVPNTGRYETFCNNYCSSSEVSRKRLTNVLRSILYRRTHASRFFSLPVIKLPDIGEHHVKVQLCEAERNLYMLIASAYVEKINGLAAREHRSIQNRCILTMFLMLRMFTSHLLTTQRIIKELLTNDAMKDLKAIVQGNKNPEDPSRKIVDLLAKLRSKPGEVPGPDIPMDLVPIGPGNTLPGPDRETGMQFADWIPDAVDMPSAKLSKTREYVARWVAEGEGVKVVVFTQFLDFVKILGNMCDQEEWGYTQLTGKMSMEARDLSIQDFRDKPETRVMIASLKAGGTGLDLSMANKCILVDLWWNEALQEQAFCRLFRIGQQKDVEVIKLIASDTIDDRIRHLQNRKTAEIVSTIGDDALKDRDTVRDLLRMFGEVKENEGGGFIIVPDELEAEPEHEPVLEFELEMELEMALELRSRQGKDKDKDKGKGKEKEPEPEPEPQQDQMQLAQEQEGLDLTLPFQFDYDDSWFEGILLNEMGQEWGPSNRVIEIE